MLPYKYLRLYTIIILWKAVIFLSKRTRIVVSSLFCLLILLVLSRCNYPTTIVASADSPDVAFADFISALKEKDFDRADSFLADGATITPVNETNYGFFDDYVDTSLKMLSCQSIGEPVYDGSKATLDVRLSSLNKSGFVMWTKDNISRIEHDYMVEQDLKEFDKDDREAVDQVMSMALEEYAKDSESLVSDIKVDFVFSKRQWKIVGNDELIVSIFGGNDNNGNAEKESEKESGE